MRKLFICFFVSGILVWSVVLLTLGLQPRLPLLPDQLWSPDSAERADRADRVCAPLATILVNSPSWHVSLRKVIRSTWGHPSVLRPLGLRLAFFVGQDAAHPNGMELAASSDLLLYPRPDTYAGLPRKVAWALREAQSACAAHHLKPPFVIKTDDDVFVNVYALEELLLGLVPETSQRKIWCLVWDSMPVIRSNLSKWYVSRKVYSNPAYPTYCSGAGYILSSPTLLSILQYENNTSVKTPPTNHRPTATYNPLGVVYNAQQDAPDVSWEKEVQSYNPIVSENVFITGFLAKMAGVKHVQTGARFAFEQFESLDKDRVTEGRTIFAHLGPEAEKKTEELWDWMKAYGNESLLEEAGEDWEEFAAHRFHV